ncbi:amyloid fiber anchoring/assembly protein TapA [Heyndrickxia sporothermodurans]|uniref:amyloid fiber anchoring/assembly protein TapA n=1 Tax=Heyndrickxia sporothermodurans TaxID=46224 RepID=UPI002DB7FEAF|nr:amyloid fiber anchoring/assembly protein TapA [Heyndrickxia sporothermodurans]
MRRLRVHRFGKKTKKLQLLVKLVAIWYIALFTGSYLTSNTGAYFNDTDDIKGTITAGTWEVDDGKWDKSSLKFLGEKDQTIKSCVKTTISAAIKNTGNNMKDTSKFEVYSAKKGNPKDGSKIGEGTIPKLATNKSMNLIFAVKEPGNYKFKALQRPGHPGKGELWSETITIDCNKTKTTTTDKDENAKDDKKNETNTPEKQQSNSEDKKGTTDKQENSDESSKNTNEKQDPKNSNGNTNEKQNPKNLNDNTNQKQEPKDPSSDGKEKTTASEPKDDGDANIKSDGDQK